MLTEDSKFKTNRRLAHSMLSDDRLQEVYLKQNVIQISTLVTNTKSESFQGLKFQIPDLEKLVNCLRKVVFKLLCFGIAFTLMVNAIAERRWNILKLM